VRKLIFVFEPLLFLANKGSSKENDFSFNKNVLFAVSFDLERERKALTNIIIFFEKSIDFENKYSHKLWVEVSSKVIWLSKQLTPHHLF
jgi:hypothetical protein